MNKFNTEPDAIFTKSPAALTKAEETRSRILTAALDLFRQRGFDQTTMREIAAEAGVAARRTTTSRRKKRWDGLL